MWPSRRLVAEAASPCFDLDDDWWLPGIHYVKTLEAWLARMDSQVDEVHAVLEPAYGPDRNRWIQRWRMFFMACSTMFAYEDGRQWGIAHHLFRPR